MPAPQPTATRSERAKGSYEAILEAARTLFHEQGFDGTSMQDVADATGLHKSTLYHYLDSKEALLEAVCADTFQRLETSLDEAVDLEGLTPRQRVLAALEGAAAVALSDVRGTNIILSQREAATVGRSIQGWRRRYDERFAELVRAAQEAGEVRGDVDAVLLTRLVLGTINWVVVWYRPDQGGWDAEAIRAAVASIISDGI